MASFFPKQNYCGTRTKKMIFIMQPKTKETARQWQPRGFGEKND
jgi:hypothetical protein